MTVRTRFAPSPTGFLHIGGVRTALFNYLFAKQHGGAYLLRLEDTDRERFVAEGVEQIVEALDWLGLKPDEGFWISEGKHQSIEYIQSERQKTGLYQKYADELLEKNIAYRDWSTPEDLSHFRQTAQANKQPFVFRKSMAKLDGDQSKPHVIRLDIKAQARDTAAIAWQEPVRGQLQVPVNTIDDFILIKSDGFPTYNFANVIDDYEMDITHVLRGEEFIPSTPKHILLYEALDFPKPTFVHLPVINGTDGKKLSKRTGDTNALDYRDKGYLPEALLNFLALLGWNDGTEQEIFPRQELIQKFSLERINNSPAVFDTKRLNWMNGHYLRQIPLDDLFALSKDFWPVEAIEHDDAYKKQVLGLVQERLKYLAELPDLSAFFFKDLPLDPELISTHKQLKKLSKDELRQLLQQTHGSLEKSDFSLEDITKRLNDLLQATDQKPVILFSLTRIATTQAPASPGLAETIATLGKSITLRRLQHQLQALQ